MPQGVLNFKLEPTDESITSNAGLILFGEYCKAIGMQKMVDAAFPKPRSNHSYSAFAHLFPLLLMLHAGGRELSDLRRIHSDGALRRLLGMERLPTTGATNKWLLRLKEDGVEALGKIHRILLERYLKNSDEPLTLDIDATVIESRKSTAYFTYKGVPGYTPILPEPRELLDEETRSAYANEHYSVIATNADESISIEEVIRFYRQRGECSENRIKEFKRGFNLDYLPTSDFEANGFYFHIGMLAYNLFILFAKMPDHAWQRHKIETIRYKLYRLAGKVTYHAHQYFLKVRNDVYAMMSAIRKKVSAEAAVPI